MGNDKPSGRGKSEQHAVESRDVWVVLRPQNVPPTPQRRGLGSRPGNSSSPHRGVRDCKWVLPVARHHLGSQTHPSQRPDRGKTEPLSRRLRRLIFVRNIPDHRRVSSPVQQRRHQRQRTLLARTNERTEVIGVRPRTHHAPTNNAALRRPNQHGPTVVCQAAEQTGPRRAESSVVDCVHCLPIRVGHFSRTCRCGVGSLSLARRRPLPPRQCRFGNEAEPFVNRLPGRCRVESDTLHALALQIVQGPAHQQEPADGRATLGRAVAPRCRR